MLSILDIIPGVVFLISLLIVVVLFSIPFGWYNSFIMDRGFGTFGRVIAFSLGLFFFYAIFRMVLGLLSNIFSLFL